MAYGQQVLCILLRIPGVPASQMALYWLLLSYLELFNPHASKRLRRALRSSEGIRSVVEPHTGKPINICDQSHALLWELW